MSAADEYSTSIRLKDRLLTRSHPARIMLSSRARVIFSWDLMKELSFEHESPWMNARIWSEMSRREVKSDKRGWGSDVPPKKGKRKVGRRRQKRDEDWFTRFTHDHRPLSLSLLSPHHTKRNVRGITREQDMNWWWWKSDFDEEKRLRRR